MGKTNKLENFPKGALSRAGESSRLMIRLLNEHRDALKSAATDRSMSDSTLARMWIVEKLAELKGERP